MQHSIPDGHVRVSVKFGAQWFATDFSVRSAGGEMDRLAAELQADGGPIERQALPWRQRRDRPDAFGCCPQGCQNRLPLCLVDRVPSAAGCSGGAGLFLEIIEFDGRAWIGVSVDEGDGLASLSYDIAPAHLAEVDTDLEALEILPVQYVSH